MQIKLTKTSKFEAVLTADDERTGFKKCHPFPFLNGVYWNHRNKKVVLMTDSGRIAFPEDIIEVTVE